MTKKAQFDPDLAIPARRVTYRSASLKPLKDPLYPTDEIHLPTTFPLPWPTTADFHSLAGKLIGVQPMDTPSSLIYYIRHHYGLTKCKRHKKRKGKK